MAFPPKLQPRPQPARPTISGTAPTDLAPGGKSYGQVIIDLVTQGVVVVNAARSAGVSMAQLGDWTREGATQWSRYLAGADWATDFTPAQQDAVWFHVSLDTAMAQHKVKLDLVSEQVARGGLERRRVRRRTLVGRGESQVVEETVTTETFAPDPEMLRWKMERLQPDVYGARARLDVMVHDLTDSDVQMDIVEERVAAIRRQKQMRDAAIDTTSSEDAG